MTSPTWGAYHYLLGPVLALAVVGLLSVLLRWAFGHGRSLVENPGRPGRSDEYGLLAVVAEPRDEQHAQQVCRTLLGSGIRATVVETTGGVRVMVFPEDAGAAEALLRRPPQAPSSGPLS